MASVTTQMIVEMRIKYKEQSWSERVNLKEDVNTYNDAIVEATELVGFRKGILPDNAFITRCRVSYLGRPREAKLVRLSYPIAGVAHATLSGYTPVAGDPNDVETCLHVRFETAGGKFVNHYFRCLPDDMVTSRGLVTPVTVVTSAPDDAPYPTWVNRFEAYLFHLQQNTAYNRVTVPGTSTTPPTVENTGWDVYIPIGVTNKKTGASFKTPRGRRPVGA